MPNRIIFRLSKKGTDDDIKAAFKNVKDHTQRAKELLRLGIEYEAIKNLKRPLYSATLDLAPEQKPKLEKKKQEKPTTVKLNTQVIDIKRNLLSGFD
jgi:hypothetical protein